MARRSSRSSMRSTRGKRDLVWVTTLIDASILESTPADVALIVAPDDWSTNSGFDRATVLGIRGWLSTTQSVVSTDVTTTSLFLSVYKCDGSVASGVMDPGVAANYVDFDVIWTSGRCSLLTAQAAVHSEQVELKAKRRVTSADNIRMSAILTSDAAAPRMNISGCFRALIQVQ